jgi:hypothetical protein
MTKNKITTIEGLAQLINETMASKEDIKEFRAEVNQKFELVELRLDRIEHLGPQALAPVNLLLTGPHKKHCHSLLTAT